MAEGRKRAMRIRDMPQSERPRERLINEGPSALDNYELVAVILGTGTPREDVLTLSKRIIEQYGNQIIYTRPDVKTVMETFGLSTVKACQVVAALELGRRLFKNEPHEIYLRTPEEVFEYVKPMTRLPKEHLRGLYLNNRNRLIRDEVISIGTLNESLAHPREILVVAIETKCAGFILVHNHPSGDPTPSQEDFAVTRKVLEASKVVEITFLDHIIVGAERFVSLRRTTHIWE